MATSFIRGLDLPVGGIIIVGTSSKISKEEGTANKLLNLIGKIDRLVLTIFGYIPGLATVSGTFRILQALAISKIWNIPLEKKKTEIDNLGRKWTTYETDEIGQVLQDEIFRGVAELIPGIGQLSNLYFDFASMYKYLDIESLIKPKYN